LDTAANALAQEATEYQQRHVDRETQRSYGLCHNQKDPVNLQQLEILKPMLPQDAPDSRLTNTDLAVGLLRLANNDLQRALEVFQEQDYDSFKVQVRVHELDQQLLQRGLLSRSLWFSKKRKHDSVTKQHRYGHDPVDEMALATLLSMGIDHRKAQNALRENGNDIEKSLLWISKSDSEPEGKSTKNETNGSTETRAAASDDQEGEGSGTGEKEYGAVAGGMGVPLTIENGVGGQSVNPGRSYSDETWEAHEQLRRELEGILEERDMEKEYLGNSLDDEWRLVQKYRLPN
jgi:hypothetical protein